MTRGPGRTPGPFVHSGREVDHGPVARPCYFLCTGDDRVTVGITSCADALSGQPRPAARHMQLRWRSIMTATLDPTARRDLLVERLASLLRRSATRSRRRSRRRPSATTPTARPTSTRHVRLAMLAERIATIEAELAHGPQRKDRAATDAVDVGDVVTVDFGDGPEDFLLGSVEEAGEGVDVITPGSPLGRALLGARSAAPSSTASPTARCTRRSSPRPDRFQGGDQVSQVSRSPPASPSTARAACAGPARRSGAGRRRASPAGHPSGDRRRGVGHAEMDQADRLVGSATVRPGDAGDPHADVGAQPLARPAGQRLGHLGAHRPDPLDQLAPATPASAVFASFE